MDLIVLAQCRQLLLDVFLLTHRLLNSVYEFGHSSSLGGDWLFSVMVVYQNVTFAADNDSSEKRP